MRASGFEKWLELVEASQRGGLIVPSHRRWTHDESVDVEFVVLRESFRCRIPGCHPLDDEVMGHQSNRLRNRLVKRLLWPATAVGGASAQQPAGHVRHVCERGAFGGGGIASGDGFQDLSVIGRVAGP